MVSLLDVPLRSYPARLTIMLTESIVSRYPRAMGKFKIKLRKLALRQGLLFFFTFSMVVFLLHPGRFSSYRAFEVFHIQPDLEKLFEAATSTDAWSLSNEVCPENWVKRMQESDTILLIPYRNRKQHLNILLNYFALYFQEGFVPRVLVIEQLGDLPFNRGLLFNIGYLETNSLGNYSCLILHDVDLLPVVPVSYTCSNTPVHMSSSIDRFRYLLPYEEMTGGVLMIPRQQFLRLNGFSNRFNGWGGEDDDLYMRMRTAGLPLQRRPPDVSRYRSLYHPPQDPSPNRYKILAEFESDGLSTADYRVESLQQFSCYTHIQVRFSSG